jgi:hypothetical protein
MAVMQSRDNRTEIAGSGGTTQFKFVTLDAGGLVTIAGSAGEQCIRCRFDNCSCCCCNHYLCIR